MSCKRRGRPWALANVKSLSRSVPAAPSRMDRQTVSSIGQQRNTNSMWHDQGVLPTETFRRALNRRGRCDRWFCIRLYDRPGTSLWRGDKL